MTDKEAAVRRLARQRRKFEGKRQVLLNAVERIRTGNPSQATYMIVKHHLGERIQRLTSMINALEWTREHE